MPVAATNEDRAALKAILGAVDNASDAYGYVGAALGELDNMPGPSFPDGWGSKLAKRAGSVQKAYNYTRLVMDTFDERTRTGGVLKLGIEIALDVGGVLLGRSLSSHPYYTYHKVMIEALADTLNVSRNAQAAVDAYRRAANAAQSEALSKAFFQIERHKVDVNVANLDFRKERGFIADFQRGLMTPEFARKKVAELGRDKIVAAAEHVEAIRANWAGLVFECLELQLLAASGVKAATAAMKKADELIAGLLSGNSVNVVGGLAARNMIEWEKYDSIVRKKKPQSAAMDPVAFATASLAKAAEWTTAFAAMFDFVMSKDGHRQGSYNAQLDKLEKVIYG